MESEQSEVQRERGSVLTTQRSSVISVAASHSLSFDNDPIPEGLCIVTERSRAG